MGPGESSNTPLSQDSSTLQVQKLHDDGSNWSDYRPRIEQAMGSKRLWRHMLGKAVAPNLYMLLNGIPVLADGKTEATDDQIESKESKITEHERKEYLAQYILLSTTSTRLSSKLKDLNTVKEMWDDIVKDTTTKSMLYLLDAEDQLTSMKLADRKSVV